MEKTEEKTTTLAKLEYLDRRYLYLLIIISVLIPLITGMTVPIVVSGYTQDTYNYVESLPEDSYVLYLFHPGFWGETRPMFIAMFKHLFMRPLKVVIIATSVNGAGYWESEVKPILEGEGLIGADSGNVYGEDYVYLGYVPGPEAMYRSLAADFQNVISEDDDGTPLDEIPMMKNIYTAYNFTAVVDGDGYAIERSYRQFGPPSLYNRKMINIGMSSCIAKYVPWIEAGEILEMPGIRGGGEYEQLIGKPWLGTKYMSSTTLAHSVLLIFLVMGNAIHFARKYTEEEAQ